MLTFDDDIARPHEDGMRRKRFERAAPTSQLQLTENSYGILELLHRFKAMRSHHIFAHSSYNDHPYFLERLRALFDHGLINKVAELRKFNALYHHDVYTLTEKGFDALKGRDIPTQLIPTNGELGFYLSKEWDHNMMIVDLLSNLELGAKEAGIRLIAAEELDTTGETPFLFPRKTTDVNKEKKVVPMMVRPDGFVGFEYPDGKRSYFAIEAEHNKPHERRPGSKLTSTNKKVEQYRDIDWQTVYKNLGIKNMRVLMVAPTPTEITNKFKVAEKVTPSSGLFVGHWLPVVTDKDVPVLPELIRAEWLQIGRDPIRIDGT